MTAFPTTGLAVHIDCETLPLFKDSARTQPATVAGDVIAAMGDANGLDAVGATLVAGAGLTLGFIGTKKGLKFPGTAGVGVNVTPANGFPQFNGDYLPITFAMSFLYPAEAAGAVRYLQRLYNSSSVHLYNVYYPDARLGVAKRVGGTAQVFTPIETVGTKDQRCLLICRYSYPGTGTNMLLDVWLDKGDGAGSVRVVNGLAVAGQTEALNLLRLGDNFNGLMRRYALWSVGLSDTDVADTMTAMQANTPIVANAPSITITNDAQLRGFSTRQGPITLAGSFANVTGTVASISTRVIRVSDGTVVRALAASGAAISGMNFTGLSFASGPATPLGTAYQREFVLLDSGGATLATIRPSTTYVVGHVIAMAGSSTIERASYEYTGAADPNLWVYTPEQGANYKQNDTTGAGVHAIGAARRAVVGEQIIVTNYGRGSTTLHYHASSTSEGPPGTVVTNLNPFQVMTNGYALCQAIPDELVLSAGANDTFKPWVAGSERVRSRQLHQQKWIDWRTKIHTLYGRTDIPVVTLPPNNRVNDLADAPIGSDASARATMARGGELAWARAATKARTVPTLDLGLQSGDIHFGQSGNEIAYARAADALAAIVSNVMYAPRITTAAFISDGAEITVQHSTGTGFAALPTNGWEGFRVYDETGARVALTGPVTTLSATKVKVPFARDPAKAYTVSFCDGTSTGETQAAAIASQANLLKDNNGLPVQPTISCVGEMRAQSGERIAITN